MGAHKNDNAKKVKAVTRFHYKTRVGEVYRARSADEQQWVYFSAMKPPECLLFKTFDSAGGAAAGGDVARFALHGAFELLKMDPTERVTAKQALQLPFIASQPPGACPPYKLAPQVCAPKPPHAPTATPTHRPHPHHPHAHRYRAWAAVACCRTARARRA